MKDIGTVFQGTGISIAGPGSFQIISVVFCLCSAGNGGGVYVSTEVSNFSMFFCIFDRCKATASSNHGGGMYIYKIQKFRARNVCFEGCIAWRCPGFITWGQENKQFIITEMNLSSECCPVLCSASSAFYGRQSTCFWNNNISKSNTNEHPSGVGVGNGISIEFSRYLIFESNQGPGCLRFNSATPGCELTFMYVNFVNNMVTSSFVRFFTSNVFNLYDSVFRNNSDITMAGSSSIGTILFQNCMFDIEYTSQKFVKCTINDNSCLFGASPTNIPFELGDYLHCIGAGTLIATNNFQNYKPYQGYHIFSSILIFLY